MNDYKNEILIKQYKDYIVYNQDYIQSDILKNEILTNDKDLTAFAQISIFLDKKRDEANKNFKYKEYPYDEYIKETIYSNFKVREKYHNTSINDFLENLDKVFSYTTETKNSTSAYVFANHCIEIINEYKKNYRDFVSSFSHEFMHCSSNTISKFGLFRKNPYTSKNLYINEMFTELLQRESIGRYFPKFIENNIPKIIKATHNNLTYNISFNTGSDSYITLLSFAKILDNFYGKDLKKLYLNPILTEKIENILTPYELEKFQNLSQLSFKYTNGSAIVFNKNKEQYSDYIKMQHNVADLVVNYLQKSNKTINDIKDIVLDSPRILTTPSGKQINLNEVMLEEITLKMENLKFINLKQKTIKFSTNLYNKKEMEFQNRIDPLNIFNCPDNLKKDNEFIANYLKNKNSLDIVTLCQDKEINKTISKIIIENYDLEKIIQQLNKRKITLEKIPQEILECKNTLLNIIKNTSKDIISTENILNNINISYKENEEIIKTLESPRNIEKKIILEKF